MQESVVIIGAGFSGLAAAYELKQRGIAAKILDAADRVGSSWRGRHEALCLNTHRKHSSQTGLAMPKSFGPYPSRTDYISYLEEYTDFLGLPIDWNVTSERVDQLPDGTWRVTTTTGDIIAENVVIATGPDKVPFMPDWAGRETFEGELIHAAQFTQAEDYAGKKVLIVGAGNSGFDIGNHLVTADTSGWMSVRGGAWVTPRYVLGIPAHLFAVWNRNLPMAMQDKTVATLEKLFFGDLRKLGIPKPEHGVVTRQLKVDGVTGAIDDGFIKAVKQGRYELVPEIEAFEANAVILKGGQKVQPDVVIAATGYRPGLEAMIGHLNVLGQTGKPDYDDRFANAKYPGLWFFGYNTTIYGNQFIRRDEAKTLAACIGQAQ